MIDSDILADVKRRYDEVTALMAQPDVATDSSRMAELGPEHRRLEEVVDRIERYERMLSEREELQALIDEGEDEELAAMAREELAEIERKLPEAERRLRMKLVPPDPEDEKSAIVEIRAGAGGDEAALFAGDLYRMYARFAERKGWTIELMERSEGTHGGFKEIVFGVRGEGAFGTMKYERGVHRVQRVPETESSGRIHTSAASVAVLPEAEEVDVNVNPADLQIDTFRSSGPGGQHANMTDSAVRLTHEPTGLVVSCQDEKSQHKNKSKAMRVLRARLYERERAEQQAERDAERRSQIGSGDRSAKVRTYNFPQDRLTDHRLEGDDKNYALESVIDGDLDDVIQALRLAENAEQLANLHE
ncbi:MAG: peptide chain release factor 1 [Bacteroidetes bacterium QS_8_64_10]|jgi:peptide chain release factor 1|nr:MAG: peptide chain release factor 1 [Bacteroidetes bacterium QS_8_64_10]